MIAAGRFDGIALPAAQEKMAAPIKGARLEFFETGHGLMRDDAAMSAMASFLVA